MMACFVFIAGYSNAQFKFGSKSSVGQTLTIDSVAEMATLLVDFNTDLDSSYWTQDAGITISWAKCQTNKGFQVNVYTDASAEATTVRNDDFKIYRWNYYDNPVRIASIASLEELMAKWAEKYVGTEDSVKNAIWKPSGCLFDMDGTGADQAFGSHPGMYKRIEYGFYYDFSGLALASDIQFDMDTYDAGNTGQTASYTLTVAIHNTDSIIGEIADFYVSGSGKKTVRVAEAIGKDSSAFNNNKVYILLKTQGTGTAIAKDKVDPTIVFDNLMVSYKIPSWIEPAAGIKSNLVIDNSDNLAVITVGADTLIPLPLKTKGRLGSLKIINDMMLANVQRFIFLKEGALKGNDGEGNYTVDIPYSIDTAVYNSLEMTWSNAQIQVAAPESGTVDDDLMFYFKVIATSEDTVSDRLELDCGTRIWYEFFYKGFAPTVDVAGVSLDQSILSVVAGDTAVLAATVEPEDASDKGVTWSSRNDAIATVADGTVTGVAAGDVYIIVTTADGEFKDSCLVTVTSTIGIGNREAAGVRLYPNPVTGGVLFIQLADNSVVQSFEVYNTIGVLILRETVKNRSLIEINTGALLEKGVYIIRFGDSTSNYVKRIIVR